MSWQSVLKQAARELKKEEERLLRELRELRRKLANLGTRPTRGTGRQGAKRTRKLSPAGRAAIARAAKKRWAKYRAAQKKS